jgi:hypothetical protein
MTENKKPVFNVLFDSIEEAIENIQAMLEQIDMDSQRLCEFKIEAVEGRDEDHNPIIIGYGVYHTSYKYEGNQIVRCSPTAYKRFAPYHFKDIPKQP